MTGSKLQGTHSPTHKTLLWAFPQIDDNFTSPVTHPTIQMEKGRCLNLFKAQGKFATLRPVLSSRTFRNPLVYCEAHL